MWNAYKAASIPPEGICETKKNEHELYIIDTRGDQRSGLDQGYRTYKIPISPKASNRDWKDTQSNEEVSNFGSSPHWYMSWMLKC